MSAARDFPNQPILQVREPDGALSPFVVNSPHSGNSYPAFFLAQSRLTKESVRRSEDCFVDELFCGCLALGAPMLSAKFPRAYLDVNREPFELDPKMFFETLPSHVNSQSLRVGGGLGTIPRIVGDGQEIYRARMPYSEALGRIDTIYRPYHAELKRLVMRARQMHGEAILIDCHSMPGSIRVGERGTRPDVIVGDRFGASASRHVAEMALHCLRAQGFTAAYNKPYAGGFITEHYGRPMRGLHALQIEVSRSLYMDEQNFAKSAGFEGLRRAINVFLDSFMSMAGLDRNYPPLAAE
jgi:N-formylglutamate amidohydrolase